MFKVEGGLLHSWIFIIWAITATWSLPDVHVECIYSVHEFECCFETPPTWDITKLLYYDSPSTSPSHTPHPPPALSSPRLIMRISSPMSRAQSGTDQTGNGFIVQHVALSFVWRDPAVVSDGMWVNPDRYLQRVKAHIKSLVTFVVVLCRV